MKLLSLVSLLALGSCSEEYAAAEEYANEPYHGAAPELVYQSAVAESVHLYSPITSKQCVACDSSSPCWNGETCSPLISIEVDENAYDAVHKKAELACPCNHVDTRDYHLQHSAILWVAFGLLFAPALYFIYRGYSEKVYKIDPEWNAIRMSAGVVNTVASIAYLTMAMGYGYTTKCSGRDFYYARYVDWLITTPIMLSKYVRLAEGGDQITLIFLVVMDIFMIAAGLIGELIEGPERWAYFGFAVLVFLPIVVVLVTLVRESGASILFGHCRPNAVEKKDPKFLLSRMYANLASLVVISWVVYPIIWILANVSVHHTEDSCSTAALYSKSVGIRQIGVISVQGEAYAYTILDIISKSVAGWYIVSYNPTIAISSTRSVHQLSHGGIAANKSMESDQKAALHRTQTHHDKFSGL